MASSRISLVFSCGDVERVRLAIRQLASPLAVPLPRQGILKLLDTFDWALERSGASLLLHEYRTGTQLILVGPRLSVFEDLPIANNKWINVETIEQPFLRRSLSEATHQRALVVQASTPARGQLFQFPNSQGMRVATLFFFELPEINRCHILLVTRRGYSSFQHKLSEKIFAALMGLDIKVERKDPFDMVLGDHQRYKKDYQSRFALEFEPSTYGCIALGQALSSEQHRAEINAPWIKDHPDPEFLHDLRVALRRTSSLIKSLEPLLGSIDTSWFRSELKYFMNATSPVRDLENLGTFTSKQLDAIKCSPEVEALNSKIARDVSRNYDELAQLIPSPRFDNLISSWGQIARKSLSLALASTPSMNALGSTNGQAENIEVFPKTRVIESARVLLARSGTTLIRKARKAKKLKTAESLHSLRKEAKTFRYLLEFYEPVLEPARTRRCINSIKKLQDALGQHQDTFVQMQLLEDLCSTYKIPKSKVAMVFDVLASDQKIALEDYRKEIKLFSGPTLFREIQLATGYRKK
ncbi:MAG: CHAD domain-containing protein [Actinomycetota bacterium]|nr:CHAD domain-containing protein [Actinomycetota bacterium]